MRRIPKANAISINGGPFRKLKNYPLPIFKPTYCPTCGKRCECRWEKRSGFILVMCSACRPDLQIG
jgi:hypothetical protein